MHGGLASNRLLLQNVLAGMAGISGMDATVCVPFPYLAQAQSMLAGTVLGWGAQDVCEHLQGAYTGQVSVAMLQHTDLLDIKWTFPF